MTRAALYLRSSKDRSDVSIDAQRRQLLELAAARGWTVVEEFADAVESGKDEDRPAFQRLIRALRDASRGWELVLVLDTSRIARRRLIAMLFERDCTRAGVRLVYRSLPEADPATDMVLRTVLQAFDEYHSLISRAKGLAGMAENVRQGWRAGGRAPRGYQLEHVATGAVRDGAPVTKTRLVVDEELAPMVGAYLRLRAQGVSRGVAAARAGAPWPASSTHAMEWQALTYAGHTVWGMHAERDAGAAVGGTKRRPRAQWQIQRGTHEPLITDDEAEAILRQCETSLQGRRVRATPLLLSGLLQAEDGRPWHSDGCGLYRLAKGPKLAAGRVETAFLAALEADLLAEDTVALLRDAVQAQLGGRVDPRAVATAEKRAVQLARQVDRTIALAADAEDPAPILRRVAELERQRAAAAVEVEKMQAAQAAAGHAKRVDDAQVRLLLRQAFAAISTAAADSDLRAQARVAISEVVDRVVVDHLAHPPVLRVHYALATAAGDNLASPRGFEPLLQP